MSAHFSSLYEQSAGLVQWSPDGRYVAMAVGQRLVVRDATDGFEIVQVRAVESGIKSLMKMLHQPQRIAPESKLSEGYDKSSTV